MTLLLRRFLGRKFSRRRFVGRRSRGRGRRRSSTVDDDEFRRPHEFAISFNILPFVVVSIRLANLEFADYPVVSLHLEVTPFELIPPPIPQLNCVTFWKLQSIEMYPPDDSCLETERSEKDWVTN